MESYRNEGFGPVVWVEAQDSKIPLLKKRVRGSDDVVLQGVAWGTTGQSLKLSHASNGQSSSVYEMDLRRNYYPEILSEASVEVSTVRLDELVPLSFDFDFVNLDIQGAELEPLRGLSSRLRHVRWIYSEVNRQELYSGIPMVGELDQFLRELGSTAW